jgi:multiple sugar transport system permease protein
LLFGVAVVYLLPLAVTLLSAFRTDADIMWNGLIAWPSPWYAGGFSAVWYEGSLGTYMRNSGLVTVFAVIATLACASLAGYAIARYPFRLRNAVLFVFLVGLFFPPQIYVVPVYFLANGIGIYNKIIGLVLVHIAYQLPFTILVLRNFFRTIPADLLDAARIDGASELKILARVVLPLSLPAMGAMGILLFTWIWNDFFWAFAMSHSKQAQTIMVAVSLFRGRLVENWNRECAASVIAMLPPLLTFALFQRYFIKGVRLGGVK